MDMLALTAILLPLYTVFAVNDNLEYGVIFGKYFWFYISMILLSMIAIPITIIKRKESMGFKLPDLLISLFCITVIMVTLSHTGRLTNKCMLLIFVTAFYFYLRIFLAGKSKLIYNLCGVVFVINGLVEAVWGLIQLYGYAPSHHPLFKITGSFFNPGPYSGWLAMVFPFALGYVVFDYFNRKGRGVTQSSPAVAHHSSQTHAVRLYISSFITHNSSLLVLNSITVLCTVVILPAAMSRASWLAALGGSVFVGIMYFVSVSGKKAFMFHSYFQKYRRKIIALSVVVVILLAISMTGLFLLKKDSASGRAFTWKIALQTIAKHPFGVGLGNFAGSYGDVQAEYFASGAGSEREEYIAGGVEYAFNEYLQICIETGIIPFLVFLTFVIYVLVLGVRNKNILPAGSLGIVQK
jgi:hypothetical protein